MRGSTFPADMHNYIWCPIYIPSFMIIGSVVSEELRWQDFGTDRTGQTDRVTALLDLLSPLATQVKITTFKQAQSQAIKYDTIWAHMTRGLYSLVWTFFSSESCECMFTMLLLSSLGQWLALHFNKRKQTWNPLHLRIVCAKFARVFGPVVLEKNLVWAKKKLMAFHYQHCKSREYINIPIYK